MAYLLAKIIILLLLSALGGALLMYWWLRRQYEDVTLKFTEIQSAKDSAESELGQLNVKYAALSESVSQRLDDVQEKINPLSAAIDKVDANAALEAMQLRIDGLEKALKSLPEPIETDLSPVLHAVNAIKIPEQKETNLSPVLDAINAIPAPEPVDLNPVMESIQGIHIPHTDLSPVFTAISAIKIPDYPAPDFEPVIDSIRDIPVPETVDLSPVLDAINGIKLPSTDLSPVLTAVKSIEIPEQKETNLQPVMDAIKSIKLPHTDLSPVLRAVEAIQIPEQKTTDLSPVLDAIDSIDIPQTDLSTVFSAIDSIHIPEQKTTNLDPVLNAIDGIKIPETNLSPLLETISAIRIPEVDLGPTREQITSLDERLHARIDELPAGCDLSPVFKRIDLLEESLKDMQPAEPMPFVVSTEPSEEIVALRIGEKGNRLESAAFGEPDDLKVISGIGTKLEGVLHGLGVYYYWQVADWSQQDVQDVDDLLFFKGRIDRDNWVEQAKHLAVLPGSAKRP